MCKKINRCILVTLLLIVTCILSGCGNTQSPDQTQNKNKNISTKNYEYYFETNIPTLESVFNYKKPVVAINTWEDDNSYYAYYLKTDIDGFDSNVNGESDYAEYSKLLLEKGYKLIDTQNDDDVIEYTYSNDEYVIILGVESTSIAITIEGVSNELIED